MMQRRKEAMARARRRRKKDIDITTNDDHILAMIRQMKEAAEEDRALNLQQKAATKKLQMLPTVLDHLKKIDLLTSFIECGICSALADWLKPLPDHSLPHLKIRESILDVLKSFPTLDSHLLKISNLGKAVMLLYRHPKEIRKNKDKAGKIINTWARPVFGLTSDFKSLTRDEREERDWAHLTQAAKRRLSSDTRDTEQANDEYE
jgi:transcription factor SPN1